MAKGHTTIRVTTDVRERLGRAGSAGESLCDVVARLLDHYDRTKIDDWADEYMEGSNGQT